MQLLQIRGFNDFFQDTFAFIKQNGKHYFKHYFIINGLFLVLLAAITYVFLSFYSNMTFINANDQEKTLSITPFENFMNENLGLFILGLFLFLIVIFFAGIISYAYTPIYLKLYIEYKGTHFSTKEIINSYKTNINKLFSFIILGILIGIPLAILFIIIAFILTITILGIFLIPLVIGLFALLYNNTLLEYLYRSRNFWEAMNYTWALISSKFWPAVGSVGLFFLISYIFQFIIQIISTILMGARSFLVPENHNSSINDRPVSIIFLMTCLFILQFIISLLMSSVIQINQGIIYFSLKEEKENINTKNTIDQIGTI